ncbi:hypothetical protein [Actinoplanes sp. NBRC 101535]|uniref:hypothetical protein n=1 Tax=Actinoplanes sp. NBRC 101535 TaxID=3032196 RepID=UPI0025559580|nr:hypothetical protein [Actinoplanes sp. NBRC 101535]
MAEYMTDDPVWDSDPAHAGPVVLQDLGVSTQLIQRLQAWNERFDSIALTDFEFTSAHEEQTWRREGLILTFALQNELPDIEISYAEDTDPRPVRDRRRP